MTAVQAFELFWANVSEDKASPNEQAFTSGHSQTFPTLGEALSAAKLRPNTIDKYPWIKARHCLLSPVHIATLNGLIGIGKKM